ncbi:MULTISPECIES: hypothetical protein [Flavobacterium]|jgi:hypothetical protein|uniref:Uncharacterized protein n=1 Tax=Flavobacterium branchiophilum TaxID=55197 RepID=A0A2H3KF93_9FLAO|nr:hypothetical protein [Flavobacterium branchiophilum]PDS21789.1 hypothetical protein B0A77_15090 [Flavobacterium branchiophilum]
MKKNKFLVIKFLLILFVAINISCVNYNNQLFFKKKTPSYTEVQLIKQCEYKIDIEGFKISNQEIDSIILNNFKKKNIILTDNNNNKHKLYLNKLSFSIKKTRSEATDLKGNHTGNYGNEITVNIDIESLIMNNENKKEKKIISGISDIKPVSTDILFDFFAVDSENKIKPKVMLENSINATSHKVVKFILKQKN